jgi:hypothetical protein
MVVHDPDGIGAGPRRSDADQLEAAIGALAHLDEAGLRRRWRGVIGRAMPDGLGRALAVRILSYRLQAQQYGDLDRASVQALASVVGSQERPAGAESHGLGAGVGSAKRPVPRRPLRPGTILAREHEGKMHRVMVLERGFAWEGKTYDSLTKVALAITGTRWNGPRFFGLGQDGSGVAGSKGRPRRPLAATAGSSP